MAGIEERGGVGHVGVIPENGVNRVRLQIRRRGSVDRSHAGEGVQVIVHDNLPGDAHDPAVGGQLVLLLSLMGPAVGVLRAFRHLLQSEAAGVLDPADILEVRRGSLTAPQSEGARRPLVAHPERLVSHVRQDQRIVSACQHTAGAVSRCL